MSDKRNKINCAKCHNAKCALSGKEMHMAVCTGYKPLTRYDELHRMNVEQLAEWIDENACNAMWCNHNAPVEPDTGGVSDIRLQEVYCEVAGIGGSK